MRTTLVKYFHEQPVFARMGIDQTIKRVCLEGHKFMYKQVCKIGCVKSKPSQKQKIGFMSSRVPLTCNEVFYVDFIGPLTRTDKGNSSIFTVMGGFSKFVFFLPVKKQTTAFAIECLKNFVFAHHGLCRMLVSDNGSHFMSSSAFYFSWE